MERAVLQGGGPDKPVRVIFATDRNYVVHWIVAATSVLENKGAAKIHISLLVDVLDVTEELIRGAEFLNKRYSVKVDVVTVEKRRFLGANISSHITLAAYYRMMLPWIFSGIDSTVIYLDCDLVVEGAIDWEAALELCGDAPLAAVPHGGEMDDHAKRLANFFGVEIRAYLNSGVLVMNLPKIRESHSLERFVAFTKEYSNVLTFHDQDALNVLFAGAWRALPRSLNIYSGSELDKVSVTAEISKDGSGFVAHYSGSFKPWLLRCEHCCAKYYGKYRRITPYWPYIYGGITMRKLIGASLSLLFGRGGR
jgi:lipopolysaccharide biosynthesis glycosyltransferase